MPGSFLDSLPAGAVITHLVISGWGANDAVVPYSTPLGPIPHPEGTISVDAAGEVTITTVVPRPPFVQNPLRGIRLRYTLSGVTREAPVGSGITVATVTTTGGQALVYGQKTLTGAGGLAVTGTSVDSGDPLGHWTVFGGFLVPTAVGEGNLSGTYNLVIGGQPYVVTLTPDEYSVRDEAEMLSALDDAVTGDIVRQRDTTIPMLSASNEDWTGITVSQEPGAIINEVSLGSVTGLTLDDITFEFDNDLGPDWVSSNQSMIRMQSCVGITIQNSSFYSYGVSFQLKGKRWSGIRCTDGRSLQILNNTLDSLRDGIVITRHNVDDAVVDGNHFIRMHEDACTGVGSNFRFDNNTATLFQGDTGKQYTATVSGTVNPEDLLTLQGGGKVLYIVSDNGDGTYNCFYNNFAIPSVGDVFEDPTGTNTLTILSISSVFDGIHGDVLQPIRNSTATQDYRILARNNYAYRTEAYDLSILQAEQNVQFLLAQNNGDPNFNWSFVDISGNVSIGGQGIGVTLDGAISGRLINNTILWAEVRVGGSDIRLANCDSLLVENNVGDNNLGGVIDVQAGGNTNLTLNNNIHVPTTDYATVFPAGVYNYPQTLPQFAPAVGSTVDLAGAGALTTAGAFRPL